MIFFFPVVLIPFFLVFSVIKVSAVVLFCFFKLKITILVLVLDLFPNMCTQFYKFFSNHCCHCISPVFHKLFFSFSSKYLKFSVGIFLTHVLFRSVLCTLLLLWGFPAMFTLLVSSLIHLWSDSMLCMICSGFCFGKCSV